MPSWRYNMLKYSSINAGAQNAVLAWHLYKYRSWNTRTVFWTRSVTSRIKKRANSVRLVSRSNKWLWVAAQNNKLHARNKYPQCRNDIKKRDSQASVRGISLWTEGESRSYTVIVWLFVSQSLMECVHIGMHTTVVYLPGSVGQGLVESGETTRCLWLLSWLGRLPSSISCGRVDRHGAGIFVIRLEGNFYYQTESSSVVLQPSQERSTHDHLHEKECLWVAVRPSWSRSYHWEDSLFRLSCCKTVLAVFFGQSFDFVEHWAMSDTASNL